MNLIEQSLDGISCTEASYAGGPTPTGIRHKSLGIPQWNLEIGQEFGIWNLDKIMFYKSDYFRIFLVNYIV